jgi:ankyrin repeat protein
MQKTLTLAVAIALLAATGAGAAAAASAADTRLVQAAKAGDHTAATALLSHRVDPNLAEPDGTTALHWAARNNDATLVDRLVRAGADVHAANRYGVTAIALACESGSAPVVERLLDAGVSPNATGPFGETALHTCAHAGQVEAAKVLIARGAVIDAGDSWRGQTPLMWAAAQRHPGMMQVLIEAGADVNARSTVVAWERQRTSEPRDKWLPPGGLTPLLLAARENCVSCIEVLAAAGADLDIVDPDRHTALILALINGHFDAAAALIEAGADLNMEDKVGRTALWAAVDAHTMPASNRPAPREADDDVSSMEILTRLLERGVAVDVPLRAQVPYRTKLDRGGDGVLGAGTTPLLRAAKAGDAPVVKMLLDRGASPHATTSRGNVNAVMMAANVGTREEDMTGRGKTQKDAIETIRLLLSAGTDVHAADTQGRTAMHGAALWGLTDVVRFLHENGASLDVKDKRGFTPLDAALGRAGGFGFDGRTGVVRQETAEAIASLLGVPLPDASTPAAAAQSDRSADDPQDGDRN